MWCHRLKNSMRVNGQAVEMFGCGRIASRGGEEEEEG